MSLTLRKNCRLCGSTTLSLEILVPHSIIADKYFSQPNTKAEKYPLDIYRCNNCGHFQCLDIVPLEDLFDSSYTYKPSKNPALIEHFESYSNLVCSYFTDLISQKSLDIGSNDGLFLQCLKAKGLEVLGIEPSKSAAQHAIANGIPTLEKFFTYEQSREILRSYGKFNHISANNVFAHNDDLYGFTKGVSNLLEDNGYFTFEISYLVDIAKKSLIGTIFHEHLSHHSLIPLIQFLGLFNLHLIDARRVSTQGGALIGVAVKSTCPPERSLELLELIKIENRLKITKSEFGEMFRKNIGELLHNFRTQYNQVLPNVSRIIGYGASRSSNLLIEYFQINDSIDLVLDNNSEKVGKYYGNTAIPIVSSDNFEFKSNDLIIPLAWIHSEQILSKLTQQPINVYYLSFYPSAKIVSIN